MKLNTIAFALAFGLWWGGGVFIATWWLIAQGGDTTAPTLLDHFYYGYSLTPLGTDWAGLGVRVWSNLRCHPRLAV